MEQNTCTVYQSPTLQNKTPAQFISPQPYRTKHLHHLSVPNPTEQNTCTIYQSWPYYINLPTSLPGIGISKDETLDSLFGDVVQTRDAGATWPWERWAVIPVRSWQPDSRTTVSYKTQEQHCCKQRTVFKQSQSIQAQRSRYSRSILKMHLGQLHKFVSSNFHIFQCNFQFLI